MRALQAYPGSEWANFLTNDVALSAFSSNWQIQLNILNKIGNYLNAANNVSTKSNWAGKVYTIYIQDQSDPASYSNT